MAFYDFWNDDDGYDYPSHRQADGRYEYGTRKCSQCEQFKTIKDFNKEEEKKSARKRICNDCGPPLPSDLSILTVVELKKEIKKRNHAIPKGKKSVLVDLLLQLIIVPPTPIEINTPEETDNATTSKLAQPQEVNATVATALPIYLSKLKVVRLKEELKKRGLSITGLKPVLLERLSSKTGIPAYEPQPLLQPSYFSYAGIEDVKKKLGRMESSRLDKQLNRHEQKQEKIYTDNAFRYKFSHIENHDGDTPLIAAIRGQNVLVVSFLLGLSSDPHKDSWNEDTKKGENAFDVAKEIFTSKSESWNQLQNAFMKKSKTFWALRLVDNVFEGYQTAKQIHDMINVIAPFWENYNKPSDHAILKKALFTIPLGKEAITEEENLKLEQIQLWKNKILEEERQQEIDRKRKRHQEERQQEIERKRKRHQEDFQRMCKMRTGDMKCCSKYKCSNLYSVRCSFSCCKVCCRKRRLEGGAACTWKKHKLTTYMLSRFTP